MMFLSWSLVLVVGLAVSASDAVPRGCAKSKEGRTLDWGCWGYAKCVNGQIEVTSCDSGFVYDGVSRKCVDQVGRTKNCGLCEGKPDAAYPDYLKDCKSYFVCGAGEVIADVLCNYPMVYDEDTLKCNVPFFVEPPCGTLGQ